MLQKTEAQLEKLPLSVSSRSLFVHCHLLADGMTISTGAIRDGITGVSGACEMMLIDDVSL